MYHEKTLQKKKKEKKEVVRFFSPLPTPFSPLFFSSLFFSSLPVNLPTNHNFQNPVPSSRTDVRKSFLREEEEE
jgi:hypothetical protein